MPITTTTSLFISSAKYVNPLYVYLALMDAGRYLFPGKNFKPDLDSHPSVPVATFTPGHPGSRRQETGPEPPRCCDRKPLPSPRLITPVHYSLKRTGNLCNFAASGSSKGGRLAQRSTWKPWPLSVILIRRGSVRCSVLRIRDTPLRGYLYAGLRPRGFQLCRPNKTQGRATGIDTA